jgi:uroporphyrinogen-III synthase
MNNVVITRSKNQILDISEMITQLGMNPVEFPCIEIDSSSYKDSLYVELTNLNTYDWILFTSRNTIQVLNEIILENQMDIDWKKIKVGAVGPETKKMLINIFDVEHVFTPKIFNVKSFTDELPIMPEEKILIPQSKIADSSIVNNLQEKDILVKKIIAYDLKVGTEGENVPKMLKENTVDAVIFTSGSTVTNFVKRTYPEDSKNTPVFCMGETAYNEALKEGFNFVFKPDKSTLIDTVNLLRDYFIEASSE